ncbi:MAG: VCBS repeat-containing protein, partial [Planctomycetota bacterium]|nr:VCBS repeat-containing protein [Planctomycetota bacterium]
DWTFTDITKESGLDQNNRRFSFAAAWEDYDQDGDADLYVANDFGRNNLYRNDGNLRFTDVAGEKNAEDSASGMSVSWSDYDRDGVMDLYVSNMFSAAGRRVTSQQLFKPGASALVRKRLQRFARGNTLLRGRKDAAFSDESLQANVNMGRWAWASSFVDLNADGWDDLVVANGYITTEDTGDL